MTHTQFTVTVDAKVNGVNNPDAKAYTINIGEVKDFRNDITDERIDSLLWSAWKVDIQVPLRKAKTPEAMQALLVKRGFTDATISEGVVKAESLDAKYKTLVKILGKEKVDALIAEELAKQQPTVA